MSPHRNPWDRWVLVPAIAWALLGMMIVAGGARADHAPNPTPSVEECREILAEFPDETWYKSRNFHGIAQPCDVLTPTGATVSSSPSHPA